MLIRHKKQIYWFVVLSTILIPIPNTLAVDQIKSTDFFVGDSPAQVSGQIDKPFSYYIGDNLSGVTNPVKSAYFTVSGVYTSGGTLQLEIDSDLATTKFFNFVNVGATPTPFEIIYKDDSNKINPSNSGTYSHTLNVIPSGITISGLGAKINITYQHVPPACPDGQPSNEKIKSTDFFVGDSPAQVSGQIDKPFSYYIGDNLSGVTNPVKSAYFTVSGVYTSSGAPSLELQVDSVGGSAKNFTFPSVTIPTSFEIIYKDDPNLINPVTAGTYSHTLNIIPTNMTISGLGALFTVTHRYIPPSCGAGMPITGELNSIVFDTTASADGPAYNSAMWKGSLGGGAGRVRLQLATSGNAAGPWNFVGGVTCSSGDWYDLGSPDSPVELSCSPGYHNNQRYFKYKIQICSAGDCISQGSISPQIDDIIINWSP